MMSNTINLSVIQRYDPKCDRILDSSGKAVGYSYNRDILKWEKSNVEGVFVLYRRNEEPTHAFVILNNQYNHSDIYLHLTKHVKFQLDNPYLLYRKEDGSILCIWFESPDDSERISHLMGRIVKKLGGPELRVVPPRTPKDAFPSSELKCFRRTDSEEKLLIEERNRMDGNTNGNVPKILQLLNEAKRNLKTDNCVSDENGCVPPPSHSYPNFNDRNYCPPYNPSHVESYSEISGQPIKMRSTLAPITTPEVCRKLTFNNLEDENTKIHSWKKPTRFRRPEDDLPIPGYIAKKLFPSTTEAKSVLYNLSAPTEATTVNGMSSTSASLTLTELENQFMKVDPRPGSPVDTPEMFLSHNQFDDTQEAPFLPVSFTVTDDLSVPAKTMKSAGGSRKPSSKRHKCIPTRNEFKDTLVDLIQNDDSFIDIIYCAYLQKNSSLP